MFADTWDEFLHIVKEEVGSRIVETWFKAITLLRCNAQNKQVYLCAPNKFIQNWVQANYQDIIQLHLGRLLNIQSPKIVFVDKEECKEVIDGGISLNVEHPKKEERDVIKKAASLVVRTDKAVSKTRRMQQLNGYTNSAFSFDTFVMGPSNSLAYTAAHAVSRSPGTLYNPLFIYGGPGLGKTHLLHAIGNGIKEENGKVNILYQTTDRFVSEFINAIRFNKLHNFQEKYKLIDVLLMDDVQFVEKKEQTQKALFHIFNALYDMQKQIVFSSDMYPQQMKGIVARLRSRMASGLVVDVILPSLEERVAILKKKASMNNLLLDDEIAHFIASQSVLSTRELQASLVRVMAFASLTKQSMSLSLAKKVLCRLYEPGHNLTVDCDHIFQAIKKHYEYSPSDLCSNMRHKGLVLTRQIAMFLMKKLTQKSCREIAALLGKKDHTTVLYAIKRIEKLLMTHTDVKHKISLIESELTSMNR
ncbi:MAG: chromosomal replication initiator protein DnaA [Candidatus Babeliales bacterium]